MDKETLYETLIEILKKGPYRMDAEELFREEISVCTELTDKDKLRLVELISSLGGTNTDISATDLEKLARLISKSPSLATFIMEKHA